MSLRIPFSQVVYLLSAQKYNEYRRKWTFQFHDEHSNEDRIVHIFAREDR